MAIPLRILAIVAAFFALASATRAEDRDCNGFGSLQDNPQLTLGRVKADVPRAYFLRNGREVKECPSDSSRCRQRSYLVPRDSVVLSQALGPFVCADFLDARHFPHSGWLLGSAVTPEGAAPTTLGDWIGNWTAIESSIVIKPSRKSSALWFGGDATWGTRDPERVRNGAIHIGSFDATAAPSGSSVSFTVGDEGTLPVDRGSEGDCKVWMRRLGPYLLASDSMNCGGANVSFDGLYWRSPTPVQPWSESEHEERAADLKAGSNGPPGPGAAEDSKQSELGAAQITSATKVGASPIIDSAPPELQSAVRAWMTRAHPEAKMIDRIFVFMKPSAPLAAVFVDYENGGTHFARDGMVFRHDTPGWAPDGVPLMVFGYIVGGTVLGPDKVVVDTELPRPGDAQCCPTGRKTWTLELRPPAAAAASEASPAPSCLIAADSGNASKLAAQCKTVSGASKNCSVNVSCTDIMRQIVAGCEASRKTGRNYKPFCVDYPANLGLPDD